MGFVSSGRIEIPPAGTIDLEWNNAKNEIYQFQVHTTVAMQLTGEGFSAELSQNSDAIIMRRGTAGTVQSEFTEVDGVMAFGTPPIPFYNKGGTHKMHIVNGSAGAGYITVFAVTGGRYR